MVVTDVDALEIFDEIGRCSLKIFINHHCSSLCNFRIVPRNGYFIRAVH